LVVTVDRKANTDKVLVQVGADNVEGGRTAACYIIEKLGGSGRVIQLEGAPGASAAIDRKAGFDEVMAGSGRILLRGKEVTTRSTRDAVSCGVGLIPEERKRRESVLGLSVFENASLVVLDRFSRVGVLKLRELGTVIKQIVTGIGAKTPHMCQQVRYLSGGNQQKVVLSKWFIRNCDVYILDEPTRGIDVGAKVEIYRLMQALAKRGAAVIMVSSELLEVLNMSDRIEVVYDGRIVKGSRRGEATEEQIMHQALGIAEAAS